MTKKIINTGTAANSKNGDSLRTAFTKINENFSELYTALGLNVDGTLNLGAFEFTGSTMTTTDSTPILIDQSVTVSSDLTVGGDIVPSVANGGNLGSLARPFRSLYVSNNTVFLGGIPLSLEAGTNELRVNNVPISQNITYTDIPNAPVDVSDLTDDDGLLGGAANLGNLKIESSTLGTKGADSNSWGNYNLYLDPGGESNAYINIPSVPNQENGNALQIFNKGDATSIVQVFGQGGVQVVTNTGEGEEIFEFRDDGKLQLPPGGDILNSNGDSVLGGGSYTPDDPDLWNSPTVNTISAALDELAARVTALQNFEIDGGNANTPALGELLIDGNGA